VSMETSKRLTDMAIQNARTAADFPCTVCSSRTPNYVLLKGHPMQASGYLPGFGYATRCECARFHYPKPMRFVWHHKLPQEAGGPTTADNLIQVCDSCHYTIHRLLWMLAKGQTILPALKRGKRYTAAMEGYQAAVAAGTVGKIPNEG
jgi:hypothetical protein